MQVTRSETINVTACHSKNFEDDDGGDDTEYEIDNVPEYENEKSIGLHGLEPSDRIHRLVDRTGHCKILFFQ